jgi:hypothetical protein
MLPLALGMMIGAPSSDRFVKRLGTKRVVAGGLLIVTVMLGLTSLLEVTTPYWVVGCGMVVLAIGIANTMAPSTDAVMGAVPETNAGVGSAMNDTTRQVGGALGVAILGSALNAAYTSFMANTVTALPEPMASAAKDSVGAAIQIAARIGGPAGQALQAAASQAFVDAMGVAVLIGAGIALAGVLIVLRFMPAGELPRDERKVGQTSPDTVVKG